MIEERAVKTHLIITDIHNEYSVKWVGKIKDTQPLFKNGLPVFAIVSSDCRVELNTLNMKEIEECAKRITHPHGRKAVTTDKAYIFIQEVNRKETLIGVVTNNRVKTFAPMYDKVGYRL